MCANYRPVTAQDRLVMYFGVERPAQVVPPEVYPGGLAPFIVRQRDRVQLARDARIGLFGLLPVWAKDMAFGRRTYNARSETMAQKPSFRDAWKLAQRCIIPAEAVYEPNWESGQAIRYAISRRDARPLGVAGLWGWWRNPSDGREWLSFTMITINADGHAVFGRMHRPGEEKRMVAILEEADYNTWLEAPADQAFALLRPFPAEALVAQPDPRAAGRGTQAKPPGMAGGFDFQAPAS
jgi:putative SOS response-associated peptidase YedK